MKKFLTDCSLLASVFFLSGCLGSQSDSFAPLNNGSSSAGPSPTATPRPSATPGTSPTPRPTASPSATPQPTATPTPPSGNGRQVSVGSVSQLSTAVSSALPGDVITIAPGTYTFTSKLNFTRAGSASQRITLRAANLGEVILQSNTLEMFNISAAYWTFENLTMEGICSSHTNCEHALHIVGQAHNTTVRNCVLRDFNAQIKGNGSGGTYPNDVLIENSVFYDRAGRMTSNPVTKIDVVGGQRWVVRGNTIGDFWKNGGDTISYGAFLKGNSSYGVFENNVVLCSKHHSGGARIGLSFGGGGTGPDSICETGTCSIEHRNGIMRNNVIMNCSDVGIYINEGQNTQIYNNYLYQTAGIDFRFVATTGKARGNIISGSIRNREGATSTNSDNITGATSTMYNSYFMNPIMADFSQKDGSAYVNKAPVLTEVPTDFCGQARTSTPDLGAIEFATGSGCASTIKAKHDRF